ncbi:hypothetical protein JOJ87_005155 [Rhodococcus ruber]|nr:hypothetical protein [Rhodococcus ruber]
MSDKGSGRSGRAHRRSRHESSPPQRGDRTGDMAPQESPLGRLRAVPPRPSEWCPPRAAGSPPASAPQRGMRAGRHGAVVLARPTASHHGCDPWPTTEPRSPTPPDDPARPRFEPALPARRRRPTPARKAPLPATGASAPDRTGSSAAAGSHYPRHPSLHTALGHGHRLDPVGTAALLCMSRHRGIISATSVRNVPNRRRSGKKRAGSGENRLWFLIRCGGARWVDLRFATCPGCNVG